MSRNDSPWAVAGQALIDKRTTFLQQVSSTSPAAVELTYALAVAKNPTLVELGDKREPGAVLLGFMNMERTPMGRHVLKACLGEARGVDKNTPLEPRILTKPELEALAELINSDITRAEKLHDEGRDHRAALQQALEERIQTSPFLSNPPAQAQAIHAAATTTVARNAPAPQTSVPQITSPKNPIVTAQSCKAA